MKLSEAFKKIKPSRCIRATAKAITEIDTVNPSYSIITELFLQDNRITSLNNISQFPNLTRIALENNAISNIEELEDLRYLPKLREIRLKGNPICNIPLFHQQIANFFGDYIIIDSKRVHFQKNKAKFENNIIFQIFISPFFARIQKKPKIDSLINQLNVFLKKNDYISFAHKIRYSYLKSDDKTYFIHLKQICTQNIHNSCEKCSNFENLSSFISKVYYSKISYLKEDEIKKLKIPFFNNSSNMTNDLNSNSQMNPLFPIADVCNFYSCCCFKEKVRILPKIQNKNKTKKVEADEKSTVAFDLNHMIIDNTDDNSSSPQHTNKICHNLTDDTNVNELTISNSFFQSSGNNQNSESSIRKVILKNDSKSWLSMPAIESDFSNFSFQRAVVFSEPFSTIANNKNKFKKLLIEESAEFALFDTPVPPEPLLQENEHIELLNTSSSSSSNSKSRRSSMKLALSTSSSSSSFAVTPTSNSTSLTNKQKFSPNSRNKVKVVKSGNKMNLPPTLSISSSSFGNMEAGYQETQIEGNSTQIIKTNENNDNNDNAISKNIKKEFSKSGVLSTFVSNDMNMNMISDANVAKSENGIGEFYNANNHEFEHEPEAFTNENEPIKKRKRIRRKKKTFPDDSVSEVFED